MKKILPIIILLAIIACKKGSSSTGSNNSNGNTNNNSSTQTAIQKTLCAHIWIRYETPDYTQNGAPIYKSGDGEVYRFNLNGTWSYLCTVPSPYTGAGYGLDTTKPFYTSSYSLSNDTILNANGLGGKYIRLLNDTYLYLSTSSTEHPSHMRAWK